jgi:hypothetical protein
MICSSLYRLFFMPSPLVQFTRELQFYLAEFSGGTSLYSRLVGEAPVLVCGFELSVHSDGYPIVKWTGECR